MGAGAETITKTLREKLTAAFKPAHLELENESHQHAVPEGAESHFRAVIVSAAFAGVSRIERQRQVLAAIDHELKNGVHAFTMRALTPEEWQAGQGFSHQHAWVARRSIASLKPAFRANRFELSVAREVRVCDCAFQ